MNWATVAPETRIYKGKQLFRWDDSPGLEHHCGICQTPLHNSRAKTSCIGKHVEPCYRFHQQLHFNGKSHECFGCNSSDEVHHNRHKEILRITRQITALDEASNSMNSSSNRSKARKESFWDSYTTTSTSTLTDTSSETFSIEQKLTRKERKKAKKSGNGTSKDRRSVEAFPREALDFISEAIHSTVHESKGAWEGTYNYTKADNLFLSDNNSSIEEEATEDEELDVFTEKSDSLSVKAPHDMTPRQRKIIKKFSTPINHSSYGGGSRKYTPNRGMDSDLYDGVDPQIFFRLNVEVIDPLVNSKARKELVAKLVAAIKEDMHIIFREEEETAMREDGFWRWAGKTAYDYIKKTREDFDWATGQKKGPPRREDLADEEMSIAEEFEDLKIAVEPAPLLALKLAPVEDFYAAKTPTPQIPKRAKRRILPNPNPLLDEDENEYATEVRIGKTFASCVKVLAPEPKPDMSFPKEDVALGWATVSRHKKSNSKSSGTTVSHKRTTSRTITVR
ncbi:hypothetical protein LOCC1_G003030 [Lachnellula occidentalis]|uniref:Uncharacterized protein n=1 Tax=Lachnellula occidentalis TaxID=215460 RepID=A0A8H8S1F5_9HELO|nr:hypothetical protein LOCC1_G003030 [Lachnellula occidentalis]